MTTEGDMMTHFFSMEFERCVREELKPLATALFKVDKIKTMGLIKQMILSGEKPRVKILANVVIVSLIV